MVMCACFPLGARPLRCPTGSTLRAVCLPSRVSSQTMPGSLAALSLVCLFLRWVLHSVCVCKCVPACDTFHLTMFWRGMVHSKWPLTLMSVHPTPTSYKWCMTNLLTSCQALVVCSTKTVQGGDDWLVWPGGDWLVWPGDDWPLTRWWLTCVTRWWLTSDQVVTDLCDLVMTDLCDQVMTDLCDQVVTDFCDQVVTDLCDQVMTDLWPGDDWLVWPGDDWLVWPGDDWLVWPGDDWLVWPGEYWVVWPGDDWAACCVCRLSWSAWPRRCMTRWWCSDLSGD